MGGRFLASSPSISCSNWIFLVSGGVLNEEEMHSPFFFTQTGFGFI